MMNEEELEVAVAVAERRPPEAPTTTVAWVRACRA